jgi:hypothetical protein
VRALSAFDEAVMLCNTAQEGWPLLYANQEWCSLTGGWAGWTLAGPLLWWSSTVVVSSCRAAGGGSVGTGCLAFLLPAGRNEGDSLASSFWSLFPEAAGGAEGAPAAAAAAIAARRGFELSVPGGCAGRGCGWVQPCRGGGERAWLGSQPSHVPHLERHVQNRLAAPLGHRLACNLGNSAAVPPIPSHRSSSA